MQTDWKETQNCAKNPLQNERYIEASYYWNLSSSETGDQLIESWSESGSANERDKGEGKERQLGASVGGDAAGDAIERNRTADKAGTNSSH